MRHRSIFASGLLIVIATSSGCSGSRYSSEPLQYPEARKGDVVENHFGVEVADPYRWLEDPDSPESREWIEAENEVTYGWLGEIHERDKIQERLTKLWNYEKYGTPSEKSGRYFFKKNDGLQNQSVLYTCRSLDDTPTVLIDPNTMSEDGTVALGRNYTVSDDGKHIAYPISRAGSDWQEWFVRDIETGKDTNDHIKWAKFTGASWTKDGKGFFYSRYDEPTEGSELQSVNYYQKLYYHRLGTDQSQDELIYERPDQKEWGFGGSVTDDGRYLIIGIWKGTERKNRVFYKDLSDWNSPVVELIDVLEAQYSFIDNDGPLFWFFTDKDAPRARVIAIDTNNPNPSQWREVIAQSKDTLRGVNIIDNKFVASYLQDARTQVKVFDIKGKFLRDVDLPGIGTAGGFSGKRSDTETFYSFTGYSTPSTIFRYDVANGKSTVFRKPDVDFDPNKYVTKQVFFESKDGTRVPMFITHKKGLRQNGENPTYLYGYGGFNIAITPTFSVSNLVWMEMGGILAVANIRGGGEYGREWHQAGVKLKKQNVFNDFISAAEWLVENGYTNPDRLSIGGGSNGGLLVGACITQRPDLFGAALPAVGVLDMLRFHKFTIGWAWVSDYGSPDDNDEFAALYAYSPLHNLKQGEQYPAVMITTGDHDDRVVPAHSFKFAAALQEAQGGSDPVMIRIQTKAGHGAGKPTSMIIDEQADRWAFLVRALNM